MNPSGQQRNRQRAAVYFGLICLGMVFAVSSTVSAQDSFPIGLICPLTGAYAHEARSQKEFAMLAVKQINAAGGVLGRQIRLEIEDTELQPGVGAKRAEQLIEKGVRYLVGGIYSSSVTAVSRVAARHGVIHLGIGGSNDLTGKFCNPYHFNFCPAGYQMADGTGTLLLDTGRLPGEWFAVTVDYSWGHTTLESLKKMLSKRNLRLQGNAFVPLRETDFSAALVRAVVSDAKVLCVIVYGQGQAHLLQQVYDLGVRKKMKIVVIASNISICAGLAPEVIEGIYVGMPWYWDLDNPVTRSLNQVYEAEYGVPGDWPGAEVYDSIFLLADAIRQARSFEAPAVIAQLEGRVFQTSKTPETVRACDHRIIQDWYVGVGKPGSRRRNRWDLFDMIGPADGDKLMLPCAETGCDMTAPVLR